MMNKLLRPHERPLYLAVAALTALTALIGHDPILVAGIAGCHVLLATRSRQ